MMDKSLWGHALLALGSTVAAYTAYTAPHITDRDDSVVVVAGGADRLTSVEWHDDTNDVTLTREGDGVTVRTTPLNKPPPGNLPQEYPGTTQAKDLLGKLAPLTAPRSLGKLTDEQLKGFGLDATKQRLVLHFGEETKTVEVGNPIFGSGDYYAKGPDGNAYLLRSTTFSSLMHGALGLQDRDLVGVPRPKFDRVIISSGGHRREVLQRHGDDVAQAFFSDPAEPDRKLDTVTAWVDRVLRLRVTDLTDKQPEGEPKLTFELYKGKEALGTVRIWSGDLFDTAVADRFKTPVTVHKVSTEAIIKDVEAVFSDGKAAEPKPGEPKSGEPKPSN
jgi:hypothetical protein